MKSTHLLPTQISVKVNGQEYLEATPGRHMTAHIGHVIKLIIFIFNQINIVVVVVVRVHLEFPSVACPSKHFCLFVRFQIKINVLILLNRFY